MQSETEQYRRIHVVQIPEREPSSTKRLSSSKKRTSFTLKSLTHMINHNQVDAISPTDVRIEEVNPGQPPANGLDATPHDPITPTVETNDIEDIPVTTGTHQTRPAHEVAQKSASTTSASRLPTKQQELQSESKLKPWLKNLLFISTLFLLVLSLIIVPIIVVHSLPSAPSPSSNKNACSPGRLLTFDDIVTNPSWAGSLSSSTIPQGYGGLNWSFATFTNASQFGSLSTSSFSGSFIASIDNTNPSNRLKISRASGGVFHACSLVVASVSSQMPFTISGFRSNTNVYTVNVTIDSVSPVLLHLPSKESTVDAVEMFGYGLTFVFDNFVTAE